MESNHEVDLAVDLAGIQNLQPAFSVGSRLSFLRNRTPRSILIYSIILLLLGTWMTNKYVGMHVMVEWQISERLQNSSRAKASLNQIEELKHKDFFNDILLKSMKSKNMTDSLNQHLNRFSQNALNKLVVEKQMNLSKSLFQNPSSIPNDDIDDLSLYEKILESLRKSADIDDENNNVNEGISENRHYTIDVENGTNGMLIALNGGGTSGSEESNISTLMDYLNDDSDETDDVVAETNETSTTIVTSPNTPEENLPINEPMQNTTEEILPADESMQNTTEGILPTDESMQNTTEGILPTDESMQNTTEGILPTDESMQNTTEGILPTDESMQNTTIITSPNTTGEISPTAEPMQNTTTKSEQTTLEQGATTGIPTSISLEILKTNSRGALWLGIIGAVIFTGSFHGLLGVLLAVPDLILFAALLYLLTAVLWLFIIPVKIDDINIQILVGMFIKIFGFISETFFKIMLAAVFFSTSSVFYGFYKLHKSLMP